MKEMKKIVFHGFIAVAPLKQARFVAQDQRF